jgi:hypothetical protein
LKHYPGFVRKGREQWQWVSFWIVDNTRFVASWVQGCILLIGQTYVVVNLFIDLLRQPGLFICFGS